MVLFFFLQQKKFLVRLKAINDFVGLPLSPHEVIVRPFLEVAHGPPEPSFQGSPHQDRIIAPPDVVLVWNETGVRELYAVII